MSEQTSQPRRVPWGGVVPLSQDPRARIVEAASRCLVKVGLERTSLVQIAREAGTSRQTIYKYFTSKDEILGAAIERAAAQASERIMEAVSASPSAADYVVELCLTCLDEFVRNPAISPLITLLEHADARGRAMNPEAIHTARRFLEPVAAYLPDRELDLDEMTETFLRFELSLLTIGSPRTQTAVTLRDYLHRALVPALGLADDTT